MRIAIVGAGVNGLTCAVSLLAAGAEVRVVTAAAPLGTVSAVAGAMVGPAFGSGDERTLEWERRGEVTVIHDYGHDSRGVFWSWGCAADVVELCGLQPRG